MSGIAEPKQVNAFVLLKDGKVARRNNEDTWTVYGREPNRESFMNYPGIVDPGLVRSWASIRDHVSVILWDGDVSGLREEAAGE